MRLVRLLLPLLLLAGACSGDDAAEPPVIRRDPRPPAVDYSGVHLGVVPGSTTTIGASATGTATILGTVTGPTGAVPGATVHVERILAGGRKVVHDVLTGADGRYALAGVPGGRYRVRAFLAPALAVVKPDVRFLEDGKEATFDLVLEDRRRVVATAAVSPSVPYFGEAVNLSVVVATQAVAADGIVRSTPIPGIRVQLDGLGRWSLRRDDALRPPLQPRASTTTSTTLPPSAVGFTDASGVVSYALRCDSVGPAGLGILVTVTSTPAAVEGAPPPVPEQRVERLELEVPDCVDPAATTVPSTSSTRRTTDTTA